MQQRTYKSDYEENIKKKFFETSPKFMIIGRANDLTVMAMCCLTIALKGNYYTLWKAKSFEQKNLSVKEQEEQSQQTQ